MPQLVSLSPAILLLIATGFLNHRAHPDHRVRCSVKRQPVGTSHNHDDLILAVLPPKCLPCGSLLHSPQDRNLPGVKRLQRLQCHSLGVAEHPLCFPDVRFSLVRDSLFGCAVWMQRSKRVFDRGGCELCSLPSRTNLPRRCNPSQVWCVPQKIRRVESRRGYSSPGVRLLPRM